MLSSYDVKLEYYFREEITFSYYSCIFHPLRMMRADIIIWFVQNAFALLKVLVNFRLLVLLLEAVFLNCPEIC